MLLKIPDENRKKWEKALEIKYCLAKTILAENCEPTAGLNVEEHCRIVGLVARRLGELLPVKVRQDILPKGYELVAASHDVGKINPHFQAKLYASINKNVSNIEELSGAKPEYERHFGFHAGVSQAALEGVARFVSEIVGKHHGQTPLNYPLKDDEKIGGNTWQTVREELIERLKFYLEREWPEIINEAQANLLAGLTSVADWIGSGPVFDNLSEIPEKELNDLVVKSVERAGFVKPKIIPNLSFSYIFQGYNPLPIQSKLFELVDGPGVYVVEALMGQGKTEAALYAAYKLLENGHASGIYFALPTRLTSEKIYDRMNAFLDRILSPLDKHRNLLLHGQAWIYKTDLGEDGKPGYSWFNTKKRGLLAPFAVGTIDQALMAVMNVKHGFVRSFGLAGKVVILDEVHSYDAYTGTIMTRLISDLNTIGCTVILLSATLSGERKSSLLLLPEKTTSIPECNYYPLITKIKPESEPVFSSRMETENRSIKVGTTSDEKSVIKKVFEKADKGEQILWIENSVSEAQRIFRIMAAWGKENGIETGLLHSRYPQIIRRKIEARWVDVFGKSRLKERRQTGRILVGTQVLEQSLDIDADLIISRIAPTDMILQRVGRLWRHTSNDSIRPKSASPEIVIITPEIEKLSWDLEYIFGSSGHVYSPYVLARTMEVFYSLNEIVIPRDLRKLIEKTYIPKNEPENYQKAKQKLEKEKQKLERFALLSTASKGQTLSEEASTRYSDTVNCDVLLLAQELDSNSGLLSFWDGSKLFLNKNEMSLDEKKEIIREIQERVINVPNYLAPANVTEKELAWLKPFVFISSEEEERIRVAILEKSNRISGLHGRIASKEYNLYFNCEMGYIAKKKEEGCKTDLI